MRRIPTISVTITVLSALAVASAACAGPTPTAAIGSLVTYNTQGALFENGNLPTPDPASVCGSSTATYLAELQNTSPLNAKVPVHWGDIVPGKDMMVAGTVQGADLGNLDLPFDHPYGGDMSMDVAIDSSYMGLGGSYGATSNGDPDLGQKGNAQQPDVVHVELESGLLPHAAASPGPATGQTWQDAANADSADVSPSYVPQPGDRVLLLGRWVLDCGHNDFHTEIHPVTFMALARTVGSTTQVYLFYNPYHESQLYNPDPSISSNVADSSRLTNSSTQPFPAYLVSEILRLAHIGDPGSPAGYPSQFISPSLEVANTDSPAQWYACAPNGQAGKHLSVSYDLVTRPGVDVTVNPDDSTGCASVATFLSGTYVPQDPVQRECVLPWAWLNQQAASEVGSSTLNIQQTIQSDLPASLQTNTFIQQALKQNPVTNCYDPVVAPQTDTAGTTEQKVTPDAGQPFPFFGWITVSWSG